MCWNIQVSIFFTALEFLVSIVLFKRNKDVDRATLWITTSVMFVEFSEILLWFYVEPLDLLRSGSLECNTTNRLSSFAVPILLMTQPLGGLMFCAAITKKGEKYKFFFKKCAIIAIIGLFFFIVWFSASEFIPYRTPGAQAFIEDLHRADLSMYGAISCTYEGPNGHLLWKFRHLPEVGMFAPNLFFYFLIGYLVPVIFGDTYVRMMFFGGLAALSAGFFYYKSAEAYSVWCWLGVFLLLAPFGYPVSKKIADTIDSIYDAFSPFSTKSGKQEKKMKKK